MKSWFEEFTEELVHVAPFASPLVRLQEITIEAEQSAETDMQLFHAEYLREELEVAREWCKEHEIPYDPWAHYESLVKNTNKDKHLFTELEWATMESRLHSLCASLKRLDVQKAKAFEMGIHLNTGFEFGQDTPEPSGTIQ